MKSIKSISIKSFKARVYDYRKDLILSYRNGIKSYSAANGGYPDLRPIL